MDKICIKCGAPASPRSKQNLCHECTEAKRLKDKEDRELSYFAIFKRDDFKCVYCGKSSIEDGVKLVLDHLMPYIDTKDNSVYNLVTACWDCNGLKTSTQLSKEVYERIIKRNIQRNKGISPERQAQIELILDTWFTKQKTSD